jgi:hypothetical protein
MEKQNLISIGVNITSACHHTESDHIQRKQDYTVFVTQVCCLETREDLVENDYNSQTHTSLAA